MSAFKPVAATAILAKPDTAPNLEIAQRLEQVRMRIRAAERRFARPAGSVALLAVSKRQAPAKLRDAWRAGQHAFGESYLQEGLTKQEQLADLDLEWHFIGRIQGNKARAIAERFDWVHSLSDARHAERLNAHRPADRGPLQVCLQVNLSGEETKSGAGPDEVRKLLDCCRALPNLAVRGLMTLPAPARTLATQRRPFRALRELRDELATAQLPLNVLSMGMSDDLDAAIAEGATLVRIGTAIFGPRAAQTP